MLTTPRWYPGYIVGTVFLTLALVWAPAGLGLARSRASVSRAVVVGAAGVVLLLAVVLGRAQEVQYYDHHYTEVDHFLQDGGPKQAYAFARKQHDKRIGIAGSGEIFFGQYGFYGGQPRQLRPVHRRAGAGRRATAWRRRCAQFRRRINAGDYDFLIVSQYTQDSPEAEYWYPIYAWLKTDPELEQIIEEPTITPEPDYVFKVKGKLDPAGCSNGR